MYKLFTFALFISYLSSSGFCRDITLYRTIIGEYSTIEQAQNAVTDESEVVEESGKYYVVSGLYEKFEDALPEEKEFEEWNKTWKHVLPVKTTADDARQRGFTIRELPIQKAKISPEFVSIQVNKALSNSVRGYVSQAKAIEESKAKPENDRRKDMIQILKPKVDMLAAMAERSDNTEDAEFAQYWLTKSFYLMGVDKSVERLPKASFHHERKAWTDEEDYYDSAMEAVDTFLERFPNSEKAEEMAYLKAATSYHLTYRGHHRYQVELAKSEYQNFIDQYPKSDRVPRAKMNLLGISLELARMDEKGFDEVIKIGEELLANYPDANDYIRSRASLIVAEAYHEGENKDYTKCIELCNKILEEFIDSEQRSVIGSAFRLKAYSHYFLKQYESAIADFTMVIEFWQNPAYHFDYQVEENLAAAYYWRGNAKKYLGLINAAKTDYQTVLDLYPDNAFAVWAQNERTTLRNKTIQ